ncbi:MAG: zinc-dependent metalloprotease [Bacteroidales bacterium]
MKNFFLCLFIAGLLVVSGCSSLRPSAEAEPAAGENAGRSDYEKLVADPDFKEEGMFTVYQKDNKLYYEIPMTELDRDMLLVSRAAAAQLGTGYGGQRMNNQVVRWEKARDQILFRSMIYDITADSTSNIFRGVQASSFAPIIGAYDIEAYNEDSTAVVIDVTTLYSTDVAEMNPRRQYQARRLDNNRSFVEGVRAFPENLEVRSVLTYEAERVPDARNLNTISVKMNHSMMQLPEEPMMPRLHDSRVGYFSVSTVDFSDDAHKARRKQMINRWRLEKKDPDAEISDPVKPITYYVDYATPEWLIPYVMEGIEAWQPAFEHAGFSNAIVAKRAPTPEEDPDWSPEDIRYPTIRWFPSTTMNAYGPHVHDPRSGEIITSAIGIYHNVQNLVRNWYFVQCAAVDERAQNLPLPDELLGDLIRYVVTHEVGHAIGLPHNMKASGTMPTDSLRSRAYTEKYGTTHSIMDYARMNYVAQPGDDAFLLPVVSIYDNFSIEWGYKPIPEATTPEEERPFLNALAEKQIDEPRLRFGNLSTIDPTQQREALGDNHVKSSGYGIANLERIMGFIVDAAGEEGEDYSTLDELYSNVVQQHGRYLGHVVTWVGGVLSHQKVYGQEGVIHTPVERSRQEEAIQFLVDHAFTTPEYLLDPDVLNLLEPAGSSDRVMQLQRSTLNQLLSDARIKRMAELERNDTGETEIYPVDQMLYDVRKGVWSELDQSRLVIDLYRRNLQRSWVQVLENRLDSDNLSGETRAHLRANLRDVKSDIERRQANAANTHTRAHLADMLDEINALLEV